ncbi:MAG: LysM peptidoglycan-binding domain-containing protein, partial [Tannerella sp.]|nr:LysM peptidoglycan-binding domain-containing protein [Tannerella sp.]
RFLGQALDPSHLIDFESGTPHNDFYVFRKGSKAGGNIYTSTSERIVYHRVKEGETLSKIAQMYRTTVNELCRLNGISSTSKLRIGQSVRCGTVIAKTPKKAPAATETVVPSDTTQQKSETRTGEYHTVREHETLNSIARQHRTTVEALCRLNNILSTDVLRAGQEICYWMPAKKQEAKTDVTAKSRPVDANNVDEEADADEDVLAPVLTQPALKKASEAGNQTSEQTTALTEKAPLYYRVQKGDTLGTIARKHGVSVDRLCKLNNITQTTVLQIGRSLRCS